MTAITAFLRDFRAHLRGRWPLGCVLLLSGTLAACAPANSGVAPQLELAGYRTDTYYRERHDGEVNGIFLRQDRYQQYLAERARAEALFRARWEAQQKRREQVFRDILAGRATRREEFLPLVQERLVDKTVRGIREVEDLRQANPN